MICEAKNCVFEAPSEDATALGIKELEKCQVCGGYFCPACMEDSHCDQSPDHKHIPKD